MHAHRFASFLGCGLLSCCLLAACGGKDGANAAQGEDGLPKPAAASGSVTGMPDPGVAGVQPAPDTVQVPDIATPPDDALPGEPSTTADAVAPDADPDAAIAVVRDYYAAINAHDFDSAYRAWSDGGRASGQSPQQFAAGFAGTEGVSVQLGGPGPVEGAAGSRYVQVPVTLDARQADGSVRRYAGSYTLRMSVVDGATPEQQTWRIASADLREVAQ